jgi:hypothetical protein
MRTLLVALVLSSTAQLAWGGVGTRSAARTDPNLTGSRFQTLRSLARYLDETAQGLLEGATDSVRAGASSDARFVTSVRSFTRSARDFRNSVDAYADAPFDVAQRVDALADVARAVEERLQGTNALAQTYPEWTAVRDVLDRMRLFLAGADVAVPAAYVVPLLAGARLARFQELAALLDESASGALKRAREGLGLYPERGAQFVGELHYFAALTRELRSRAEAGSVSPKAVGTIVDDLLKEARAADRRMRDAGVFKEVWNESSRSITLLQAMANLVRS